MTQREEERKESERDTRRRDNRQGDKGRKLEKERSRGSVSEQLREKEK